MCVDYAKRSNIGSDLVLPSPDDLQGMKLVNDLLTGPRLPPITVADMAGVASGAILGNSSYVNNARYCDLPQPDTEFRGTKAPIRPSE